MYREGASKGVPLIPPISTVCRQLVLSDLHLGSASVPSCPKGHPVPPQRREGATTQSSLFYPVGQHEPAKSPIEDVYQTFVTLQATVAHLEQALQFQMEVLERPSQTSTPPPDRMTPMCCGEWMEGPFCGECGTARS